MISSDKRFRVVVIGCLILVIVLLAALFSRYLATNLSQSLTETNEALVGGKLKGELPSGEHTLTFRGRTQSGQRVVDATTFTVSEEPEPTPSPSPSGSPEPSPSPTTLYVRDFGAVGDGVTDDTAAIITAIAAAAPVGDVHKTLVFTEGRYRVTNTLAVGHTMTFKGEPGSVVSFEIGDTFSPEPPHAAELKILFHVQAAAVTFEDMHVDGLALPASIQGTHVALQAHREDIVIRRMQFTNLTAKWLEDPNPHTLKVTHAVRLIDAHRALVEQSTFDEISGAAVVVVNSDNTNVSHNSIDNTGWYSINYDWGNDGAEIRGNEITGDAPGTRYYGGSVNLMSQIPPDVTRRNRNITVAANYFSGVHSYSTVIRVLSASEVVVRDNVIDNATQEGGNLNYIYVDARSGGNPTVHNGPSDHVTIHNNLLRAGGRNNVGILVRNNQPGDLPKLVGEQFAITNNTLISPGGERTFAYGIAARSNNGGLRDITITGNAMEVDPLALDVGGLRGGIQTAGSATTFAEDVLIRDNTLCYVGSIPPQEPTLDIGVVIEAGTKDGLIEANTIQHFPQGVTVEPGAQNVIVQNNTTTPGACSIPDPPIDLDDYGVGS